MKTAILRLGKTDEKAKKHILASLDICAFQHVLSRKLFSQFQAATGDVIAIVGDWYNLKQMPDYDHYIPAPSSDLPFMEGDRPRDQLISFVKTFLEVTHHGIVVSENWGWNREDVQKQLWPPERVSFFNDEVYHVLTPDMVNYDAIDRAVAPRHHWQTTVCARSEIIPGHEIAGSGFFDRLVRELNHLIVPAFNCSGYLIWSPFTDR